MAYLRRVAGQIRRNRIKNYNIRNYMEVIVFDRRIEKRKLKWHGHVMRIEDSS